MTLVEDDNNSQLSITRPALKTFSAKRISMRRSLGASKHKEIKQRLDNVDPILAGLQAGIMRVVDSLQVWKQSTELCIKQLGEDIKKISEVNIQPTNHNVNDRLNKFEDTMNKKLVK